MHYCKKTLVYKGKFILEKGKTYSKINESCPELTPDIIFLLMKEQTKRSDGNPKISDKLL